MTPKISHGQDAGLFVPQQTEETSRIPLPPISALSLPAAWVTGPTPSPLLFHCSFPLVHLGLDPMIL